MADVTIDELQRERDEILNVMQGMTDKAPEPGSLKVRDVIHRGDDDYPAPVVASALKSAGYVYLYDTRSGDRSLTNVNMLPAQLKKRREDGSPVFTTVKPNIEQKVGAFKCMLHPDDPNRAHYDELGLPTCRKANLTSEMQVKRHMQNRHRVEYATIEEERQRKEKEEDRAFQRAWMEKMGAGAGKAK